MATPNRQNWTNRDGRLKWCDMVLTLSLHSIYRAGLHLAILGLIFLPTLAAAQGLSQDDIKAFRKAVDTVTVQQFIDPLTFMGQDDKVYRLAGIDAPGLYDPAPPAWIGTATTRLNTAYRQKQFLLYVPKNQNNRSNRLGQILVHAVNKSDGTWIQGDLVKRGEARAFPTDTNPELAEQLYTLERPAIMERTGLWALPENRPLPSETATESIGRVGIVTGKIIGVSQQQTMLYLNFGADWKSDMTIGLSSRLRQGLARKNIDPKTWVGKDVMVRGFIESYYGPYINLLTPAQITFLEAPIPPEKGTKKGDAIQTGGLQQLIITPEATDNTDAPQP